MKNYFISSALSGVIFNATETLVAITGTVTSAEFPGPFWAVAYVFRSLVDRALAENNSGLIQAAVADSFSRQDGSYAGQAAGSLVTPPNTGTDIAGFPLGPFSL